MNKLFPLICSLLCIYNSSGQSCENLVLITLDGVRWQEVFTGADPGLISDLKSSQERKDIKSLFKDDDPKQARKKLMPWTWSTLAGQGQIYGNRQLGNKVDCTNRYRISYPGYNEILTGYSDPWITSNANKYNPNITILEWFNGHAEFCGKVVAFASWDAFPYIINDQRSGITVNAGFSKAEDNYLTSNELFLNELIDQLPGPWESTRLDAYTHQYMMEYLEKYHPRLTFISYGEMDDYAHSGQYGQYLQSINQTDKRIADLWNFLECDPFYAGRTALIITTDHGRGYHRPSDWKNHGILTRGSGEIWMAFIGPSIPTKGEIKEEMQLFQNQIAKSLAFILGYQYEPHQEEAGEIINHIFTN
ncbi:MAG: phosphoglyceromutase [Saprospiraceae bacterium]|nr:phosphoglyceromutase [Saprospiraceae bacterium]